MGKYFETIPEKTIQWCLQQKMFWVASAPLAGNGHVNVSPKGGPYFGIPDERTFWYLDLSGSGNETIAHMYEPGNGRITIMFNAFDGPPEIVRFWGKGLVLEYGTREFLAFVDKHNIEVLPGTRSIIVVHIHQVGSSCGYSVPLYEFKKHRQILNNHWIQQQKKVEQGKEEHSMPRYWAYKSAWSMDGLPGMKIGLATARAEKIAPIVKMVGPLAPKNGTGYAIHTQRQIFMIVILSFLLGAFAAIYGLPLWVELKTQIRNLSAYVHVLSI
ncbi:uncharacterized protein PV09_06263 [Verruconis gallopava]|uniref:Pyridoxamine 5'-phosphate oxidase putative domain-containing protein n=1 Tax=Verruconis gallopava TaxID=253628 RepID=A0A0D2A6U7_9PEZI|nr:uncharacterized protein PV09_06263 [Verruconis gallopava]KIW02453.1 hypothetical protein PV09_06263 [Verruconis gallopava]